ncbi:MAG: HAMP domain-containing protein, partial [Verrucomicrobiaceae bacterium]
MWGREWAKTLRWRLIWPSIAVNLAAVATTAWLAHYILCEILVQQVKARAELVSHAVNYAAESASQTADLQRFVYSLSIEKDVSLIVVAGNHLPRVLACTRHELNGTPVDGLPWPEAIPALKSALRDSQTSAQELTSGGVFQLAVPLLLTDVHRPDPDLRPGAVLVRIEQSPIRAEITRLVWMGTSLFILLLLATNALVLFLIQGRVLQPLNLIGATLRLRAGGDTSARAPVLVEDEIGSVASAMNAVFDRWQELETEAGLRAAALTET